MHMSINVVNQKISIVVPNWLISSRIRFYKWQNIPNFNSKHQTVLSNNRKEKCNQKWLNCTTISNQEVKCLTNETNKKISN